MKKDTYLEFKDKLKTLRQEKGLSRKQLAELTKISVRTIESYEQGAREPKLNTIDKLANALEVDPIELTMSLGKYIVFKKLNKSDTVKDLYPALSPAVRDSLIALMDNLENGKIKSEHLSTSDITDEFNDLFICLNELLRPTPPEAEFIPIEEAKIDLKKELQWEQTAKDQASQEAIEALENIINLLNPKYEYK